jgi:ribose 5-phosphate isomerase A
MSPDPRDAAKRLAAARAAELARPGMRLGLGTGSTAAMFVEFVGEKVRAGMDLLCVPTSEATRRQAEALGIPLTDLDATPELDLTVDGADEFDPRMNLVKGGGGALLREKIVASASKRMVVIVDGGKRVERLGGFPLPVEVNLFGLGATARQVERAAAGAGCAGAITRRVGRGGDPFVTDGGHAILDCAFGSIPDPARLSDALLRVPGVVEHGLFIGLAAAIIVAEPGGLAVLGEL